MDKYQNSSWFKRNFLSLLATIVPLVVVIAGGYIATVRIQATMEARMAEYQKDVLSVRADIVALQLQVRIHHEDTQRHMDPDKWNLLQSKIQGLSDQNDKVMNMLWQHSQRTERISSQRPVN